MGPQGTLLYPWPRPGSMGKNWRDVAPQTSCCRGAPHSWVPPPGQLEGRERRKEDEEGKRSTEGKRKEVNENGETSDLLQVTKTQASPKELGLYPARVKTTPAGPPVFVIVRELWRAPLVQPSSLLKQVESQASVYALEVVA
jgi:hypothetical protein